MGFQYKKVKAVIKFGRKLITLDKVTTTLRSWELEAKPELKNVNKSGDNLNLNAREDREKRITSSGGNQNQEEDAALVTKRDTLEEIVQKGVKVKKEMKNWMEMLQLWKMDMKVPNVLLVATKETEKMWILDSGPCFHMTPNTE